MADIRESVYRQIIAIRREGRHPQEIRLGAEDMYELRRVAENLWTGPYQLGMGEPDRLFGVPIRRLPIRHAVSVV